MIYVDANSINHRCFVFRSHRMRLVQTAGCYPDSLLTVYLPRFPRKNGGVLYSTSKNFIGQEFPCLSSILSASRHKALD